MQPSRESPLENVLNQPLKRPKIPNSGRVSSAHPYRHATKGPLYPTLPSPSTYPAILDKATTKHLQQQYRSSTQSPTPDASRNDILQLSHVKWGLDSNFVEGLKNCGIEVMYEWQAECLSMPGLLEGEKNLVYTAPTSAGKSLVAEILMIKRVMETRMKAIVVLPYVAIVTEKVKFLKKVVEGIEPCINVTGYHGGAKSSLGWKDADISVCTIEKANSIVNAALEDGSIGGLGVVVFDELHMLEDDHRGYILEVLATKLLCLQQSLQMIGMSATLSNISELGSWLQACQYHSTYRPIPLQEYLVYENEVYNEHNQLIAHIPPSEVKDLKDPVMNAIISLAYGCVVEGYSALVFCPTRDMTERITKLLGQFMPPADEDVVEQRREVIRDLAASITGLDRILGKSILLGVAFHHAGLTTEERDMVAEAYDKGLVKVICCTPTMAAGVNLPARRVIIHPRTGRTLLTPAMLRQMRGRAGRKGKDTVGESYLCCPKVDKDAVKELLKAPMPRVKSSLTVGIQRALLEVISTRLATSLHSLDDYIQCTLLYHTSEDKAAIAALVQSSLTSLTSSELIREDDTGGFEPTPIGIATVVSGFGPEEGVFLHRELSRALMAFNLETDMHIIYNFTPIYGLTEVNWKILMNEIEVLDESGLRTVTFVGVNPALVNRMARGGTLKEDSPENVEKLRVHRRFFVSLMLRDLINEIPIHHVANKYETPRGFVQQLASTCKGFASTTGTFCKKMGWGGLAVLLEHYTYRLDMGVKDDLMELVKLPFVKSYTARMIYNAGLRSIAAVAAAEANNLILILEAAQPQRLRLKIEEEGMLRKRLQDRAERIIKAARRLHGVDPSTKLLSLKHPS
ncbi:P-loop containing nucleoside triphosphate hydrolase protein [Terfezia boudieri ATCC MYA-4762]|uniref:P-loop containing nucleoside triphosphate hydrolase protein n=1 Tax=Terfezia boudieri ATCC MYA-4762 TaxID=1051890 RepID=A0A3N4LBK3_9PEZI|nr:P-loop containing nucleoside triphosphate hydrolase protein [Terfezia boudieri ATCC MYA-4762]